MKNNISYYRHETNSHFHWKFKTLRRKFGWSGEGRFWALNNMIADSENCWLDVSDDKVLQTTAYALDMNVLSFIQFIDYLHKDCRLIIVNEGYISTNRLQIELKKFIKENYSRLYNTNVKRWYEIIKRIFKRDNYTCQYCYKIGGKLECDHIIPISKGGSNEDDNLTTSCQKCNRQKRDKTVHDFLNWRAAQ